MKKCSACTNISPNSHRTTENSFVSSTKSKRTEWFITKVDTYTKKGGTYVVQSKFLRTLLAKYEELDTAL